MRNGDINGNPMARRTPNGNKEHFRRLGEAERRHQEEEKVVEKEHLAEEERCEEAVWAAGRASLVAEKEAEKENR